MGGVASDADDSAGEKGVVDVCEGGLRDASDLVDCVHYALQSLLAGAVAASVPRSDAASEDALNGAPIE